MENYIKAVLCVYPSMKSMEKAYEEHIKTQALLSCDGCMTTEKLAEYLMEEILRKRRLIWLETIIEEALSHLTELEQTLVEAFLFVGKKKESALLTKASNRKTDLSEWSERTRFRIQAKALEKLEHMLCRAGLTKCLFEEELLEIELIGRVYRKINREKGA